ncbi:Protein kinase domain [Macleaya cordata]|uniref:Protein kinase domain n=1 Tax=Macleaya cordata TaxID=56857 RepID=A0A200QDJ5_MACCD|nr:Protein kinase domain [Macleaya cordata]
MSKMHPTIRQIPLSVLLIISISLLFQVNCQSQNHDQEQTILLKLKNQWKNPSSIKSWDPSTLPHCNWTGIICDINGFVTGIELVNMNITEKIPPFVCDLKNLTEINLSNNYIPGEFPTSLYNCSKLETLDLSLNYLVGRIPNDIDRISGLRLLNLGGNNFSGDIPASIGRFRFLHTLQLFQNQFKGSFPPEIGNLSNLEVLHLPYNDFLPSRIPLEFGKLKKLVELWMTDSNLIGEIPETIATLSNLELLNLATNNLSGKIPRNLFLLKNLTYVNLSDNKLSGEIPSDIESLYLDGIDLSINMLTGTIPESVGKWKYLRTFDMYANRLTGEIPASIGRIPSLTGIRLFMNNLTGVLPPELGLYSKLEYLDVPENQLSGNLPENLCAGGVLTGISVYSNNLSGELPRSFQNCTSLTAIMLEKNKFSGEIPAGFWSFTNLSTVIINDNLFSGELPDKFTSNLERLEMNNNRFSGSIPSQISNSKNLTVFNASNNLFSGKIPVELTALSSLQSLSLDGNQLSVIAGATFLVSILLILFAIRDFRKRKHEQDIATWKLTSFQRLDFTESNILSNLTENNLIGSGGSGKVYRVPINRSENSVAVKKIWSKGKLDQKLEKEFQAEVQILGTIKHYNIVKLLCCISSKNSKLLVYEYMENGSLDQWLHEKNRGLSNLNQQRFLDWPKRLQIAIGIAQGLSYMHHNCSPPIIHRDVKSSNILLDSDFKARIADFGLAKMLSKQGEPNSASVIAGSFGYIAPEYGHTTKVNEKIDVYSFGVVLLELVTGREANKGDEHTSLAEWLWRRFQEVTSVDVLMDEEVKEESYLEEMRMVFRLGLICTGTLPSSRPTMKEALQILLRHGPLQQEYKEKMNKAFTITEYDAAPLLVSGSSKLSTSKGSRRNRRISDVDDNDDNNVDNFASNV